MKNNRHPSGTPTGVAAVSEFTEEDRMIDDLVVTITKILAEKGLTYEQAYRVLDLAQSEIKECKLIY
jgi:predicted transcriptional regulator